jgi:hypothetical protein
MEAWELSSLELFCTAGTGVRRRYYDLVLVDLSLSCGYLLSMLQERGSWLHCDLGLARRHGLNIKLGRSSSAGVTSWTGALP